jgi:hypothetical protein
VCIFTLGDWKNMLTGLYTMQDTVDDSEGMASSSESEDDEENDSLVSIMADRNLWSTQVSFFVSEIETNFLFFFSLIWMFG